MVINLAIFFARGKPLMQKSANYMPPGKLKETYKSVLIFFYNKTAFVRFIFSWSSCSWLLFLKWWLSGQLQILILTHISVAQALSHAITFSMFDELMSPQPWPSSQERLPMLQPESRICISEEREGWMWKKQTAAVVKFLCVKPVASLFVPRRPKHVSQCRALKKSFNLCLF